MKALCQTLALILASSWVSLAQAAPCLVLHDQDDALTDQQEAEALEQARQALLDVGLTVGPAPCDEPYRLDHRRRGQNLWIGLTVPWESRKILVPISLEKRSSAYTRLARSARSTAPSLYLQAPGSLAESGAMILGDLTGRYDGVPEGEALASEQAVAEWDEKKEEADRRRVVGGGAVMGGLSWMRGSAALPTLVGVGTTAGNGPFSVKTGFLAALDTRSEAPSVERARCLAPDHVLESLLAAQLSTPVGDGRPYLGAGFSFYLQCVETVGRNFGISGPHLDAGWIFLHSRRVHPVIQVSGNIPVGPLNYSDQWVPWVGVQAGLWMDNK